MFSDSGKVNNPEQPEAQKKLFTKRKRKITKQNDSSFFFFY